jgi:hypothetical protein
MGFFGCDASDYAGFVEGQIAVISRGMQSEIVDWIDDVASPFFVFFRVLLL